MDLSEHPQLAQAVEFHGHLGPYVALGVKIGEFAMAELGAEKFFGARVEVFCKPEPPVSCVVDGLQYSTGCTLGKGNISLQSAPGITVIVTTPETGRSLTVTVSEAGFRSARSKAAKEDLEGQALAVWLADNEEVFEWEAPDRG